MALLKLAPCFKDHLSNPHPNKIPLRREVIVPVWGCVTISLKVTMKEIAKIHHLKIWRGLMTSKELKRLSRRELLEMLIEQMKENQRLRSHLEQAEAELENRELVSLRAGSMAEAAMQLNGVFEAADKAARQYLENVYRSAQKGDCEK